MMLVDMKKKRTQPAYLGRTFFRLPCRHLHLFFFLIVIVLVVLIVITTIFILLDSGGFVFIATNGFPVIGECLY
jgi:hypothetical protein